MFKQISGLISECLLEMSGKAGVKQVVDICLLGKCVFCYRETMGIIIYIKSNLPLSNNIRLDLFLFEVNTSRCSISN